MFKEESIYSLQDDNWKRYLPFLKRAITSLHVVQDYIILAQATKVEILDTRTKTMQAINIKSTSFATVVKNNILLVSYKNKCVSLYRNDCIIDRVVVEIDAVNCFVHGGDRLVVVGSGGFCSVKIGDDKLMLLGYGGEKLDCWLYGIPGVAVGIRGNELLVEENNFNRFSQKTINSPPRHHETIITSCYRLGSFVIFTTDHALYKNNISVMTFPQEIISSCSWDDNAVIVVFKDSMQVVDLEGGSVVDEIRLNVQLSVGVECGELVCYRENDIFKISNVSITRVYKTLLEQKKYSELLELLKECIDTQFKDIVYKTIFTSTLDMTLLPLVSDKEWVDHQCLYLDTDDLNKVEEALMYGIEHGSVDSSLLERLTVFKQITHVIDISWSEFQSSDLLSVACTLATGCQFEPLYVMINNYNLDLITILQQIPETCPCSSYSFLIRGRELPLSWINSRATEIEARTGLVPLAIDFLKCLNQNDRILLLENYWMHVSCCSNVTMTLEEFQSMDTNDRIYELITYDYKLIHKYDLSCIKEILLAKPLNVELIRFILSQDLLGSDYWVKFMYSLINGNEQHHSMIKEILEKHTDKKIQVMVELNYYDPEPNVKKLMLKFTSDWSVLYDKMVVLFGNTFDQVFLETCLEYEKWAIARWIIRKGGLDDSIVRKWYSYYLTKNDYKNAKHCISVINAPATEFSYLESLEETRRLVPPSIPLSAATIAEYFLSSYGIEKTRNLQEKWLQRKLTNDEHGHLLLMALEQGIDSLPLITRLLEQGVDVPLKSSHLSGLAFHKITDAMMFVPIDNDYINLIKVDESDVQVELNCNLFLPLYSLLSPVTAPKEIITNFTATTFTEYSKYLHSSLPDQMILNSEITLKKSIDPLTALLDDEMFKSLDLATQWHCVVKTRNVDWMIAFNVWHGQGYTPGYLYLALINATSDDELRRLNGVIDTNLYQLIAAINCGQHVDVEISNEYTALLSLCLADSIEHIELIDKHVDNNPWLLVPWIVNALDSHDFTLAASLATRKCCELMFLETCLVVELWLKKCLVGRTDASLEGHLIRVVEGFVEKRYRERVDYWLDEFNKN